MKKNIIDLLLPLLQKTLEDLNLDTHVGPRLQLDYPTNSRFGDITTNIAMHLCKASKQKPHQLAVTIIDALKKNLDASSIVTDIKEIKVEGAGFINFYLNDKYFHQRLTDIVSDPKDSLSIERGNGEKVLLEFVSANPTGSLSVAHARQAVVGDSLGNILDFLGYKVKREYYLNDEGNQINILGESVSLRMKELGGESVEFPDNHYQGKYIYDIAAAAEKKRIKKEKLADFAADFILAIIKKELDDFGIKFDIWYSQKELTKRGKIATAFDLLKKNNLLYEKDGATWFKSTEFGDDKDRVVVKSDGSYTYLAPDIAYHQDKYKRGFKTLINLWGPDHHGYISRLKAAVAALGFKQDSLSVIIVQLATIYRDGKPVQMSTRKGEYITLREVLEEVGRDAARFFFLMRRTSSHLDFDLDVAKKQTPENPVYYVQYAHARICSILRNYPKKINYSKVDTAPLLEKEELDLIKKITTFSASLNICLSTQDPYMLTVYLQELSEAFHKFYDNHRVLNQEGGLTEARLALIEGTRIAISTGLRLLGVSQPEKM